MFERFRQGDSGTRRRFGGRHLVELHGGTVAAESAGEGSGSAFRVLLPVRAAPQPATEGQLAGRPSPPDTGTSRRLDGIRVLVVDDEPDARELFTSMLEAAGAAVIAAPSAAEALEVLEREGAEVLLSDIEMPGQDGYELLHLARALPSASGQRLATIAVTAYARSTGSGRWMLASINIWPSRSNPRSWCRPSRRWGERDRATRRVELEPSRLKGGYIFVAWLPPFRMRKCLGGRAVAFGGGGQAEGWCCRSTTLEASGNRGRLHPAV